MEGTVLVTDRYHAWPGAGAALGHHEECVPHAGGKVEGQLGRDAPASFEQRMEDLAIHGTDDTGVNSDVGRGQVAAHWSASAAILKLHVDQQHVANLVRSGPGHRGTPIVEALRTTGRQPDRLTGHANPYQRPAVDEDDGTDYGPQPPGGAEMSPGQLNDGE